MMLFQKIQHMSLAKRIITVNTLFLFYFTDFFYYICTFINQT